MDWLGILLLALISGMFIFGVTEIKGSDNQIVGILTLAIGVLSLLAYVLYAWRRKDRALIPLNLFRSKNFSASFIALFLWSILLSLSCFSKGTSLY